jgi:CheY-like chemotaxis protein
MKGDKERCLAAGMDGYLAKPLCSRDMFDILAGLRRNGTGAHIGQAGETE